jgi:hypothetical protein
VDGDIAVPGIFGIIIPDASVAGDTALLTSIDRLP